jgi:hypothetical protein
VARVPVARKVRSYRDWRWAMQQKSMQKKNAAPVRRGD